MIHVYLDLNIFDSIEKRNDLNREGKIYYDYLYDLIVNETIITPYSNAHINDLKRAYTNDKERTLTHIENIKFLTNDLSIVNYWGDNGVTWSYRDIFYFFNSSLEDDMLNHSGIEEFIDASELSYIYRTQLMTARLTSLPETFKHNLDKEPILKSMFPRAYKELTQHALIDDIYCLNTLFKKDFTLFKRLKAYFYENRNNIKIDDLLKQMNELAVDNRSLIYDDNYELYMNRTTSKNSQYHNVTTLYFKMNFEGFKADTKYDNSIDDAIHTFYAAHCDYFITNDDKCAYKAHEVFKKLKLKTKVMSAKEFYNERTGITNE